MLIHMGNDDSFGAWFRPIVEASGLKQKAIAAEADIDQVSLSRILNGAQGVAKETAMNLARAINTLAGREVANEDTAIRLAVGLKAEGQASTADDGFFSGLDKLSPERREIARKQVRAIIDALVEEEHDTNYINDDDTAGSAKAGRS